MLFEEETSKLLQWACGNGQKILISILRNNNYDLPLSGNFIILEPNATEKNQVYMPHNKFFSWEIALPHKHQLILFELYSFGVQKS